MINIKPVKAKVGGSTTDSEADSKKEAAAVHVNYISAARQLSRTLALKNFSTTTKLWHFDIADQIICN